MSSSPVAPKRQRNKKNNKNAKKPGTPQSPPSKRNNGPTDMTVFLQRTDLYDCPEPHPPVPAATLLDLPVVAPFEYRPTTAKNDKSRRSKRQQVATCRLPNQLGSSIVLEAPPNDNNHENPLDDPSIKKYWKQRRRLFHHFDAGIQLDTQGWYSVTPEQVATHVAQRTVHDLCDESSGDNKSTNNLIVLDAFGGCGGNAIAFSRQPHVSLVVCVDVDRNKLQCAAHNAHIYNIPPSKILFLHVNVLFVLEYCYQEGNFVLDAPILSTQRAEQLLAAMPPPVATEQYHGFQIGGIDLLPRSIGCIFMDPPWGGVDYNLFGKQGYSLQEHMRIPRQTIGNNNNPSTTTNDAFFDHFAPQTKLERKAVFNCEIDQFVNGARLLELAAAAQSKVVFDLPRNTSRNSLGMAALSAGYVGNCKLEEHYLNGRLKTVTAYFGKDWRQSDE